MEINKQKLAKLRQDMDLAYNQKQQAWQDKQIAFEKVISLVDAYNNRLWHNYEIARTSIKIHKKRADDEYIEMVKCFEASQEAFSEGDGALAKELSEEGHEHEEKLHIFNKAVQDCCKKRDEARNFAKEHSLPNDINKLLELDLAMIAKSNSSSDIFEALKIAKQLSDNFELLHKDFKQKQTLYKNYKQYGESPTNEKDGWTDLYGGVIGDQPVLVKFGTGKNEGHTLIADNIGQSKRFFDRKYKDGHRNHNHYGPKREGPGYVEEDRGKYTGPGH